MDEILWHRRETRRQTENTKLILQPRESPAYSNSPENTRLHEVVLREYYAKCRPTEAMGKAEVSWDETSTCTMRTAGVRDQASEERFAERTPGKASSQSGLTATDEDWESERKRGDTEARGLTHESV